jgi:hypothetical protein
MAKDLLSLIKPGMGLKVLPGIGEYDYDYWNGRLLIWEAPEQCEDYAIGVDPAEGVSADRSVCEVIKIGNLHHPDVQVAEFTCDYLDPIDFGNVVNTVGRLYSGPEGYEAFATIECNAPCGDTMLNDMRARLDYTNLYIWKAYDRINNVYTNKYGWWTNRVTRPKLIARGLHAFTNGDLVVNSPFLLDEMSDFERDHFIAKAKARHGRHDDRIMALLIGYWGAHDDEWLAGEDIAEERRLRRAAKDVQNGMAKAAPVARRADYQNQALTYAQMMARANEQFWSD